MVSPWCMPCATNLKKIERLSRTPLQGRVPCVARSCTHAAVTGLAQQPLHKRVVLPEQGVAGLVEPVHTEEDGRTEPCAQYWDV